MAKQQAIDAALNALADAMNDPNPDHDWQNDLPEAPAMPVDPDEHVAIVVPPGGHP